MIEQQVKSKNMLQNCFESFKKGIGGIIHVNIEQNEINKVVKSHYNYNMSCKDWLNKVKNKVEFVKRVGLIILTH